MDIDDKKPENKKAKKQIKLRIQKFTMFHSKEILSAVVIGVLVTLISTAIMNGFFYRDEEEVEYYLTEQNQTTNNNINPSNRSYFIRANLAQAISAITPVKIALTEYYMSTGSFPTKNNEFEISIFDLHEHETIEKAYLTNQGGVGIHLSDIFGENKSLTIHPVATKNGTYLKWRCSTNIDKQYLGFGNSKICDHKEAL